MPAEITRVLIANRGAIARRIIRTCKTLGLQTVAVFSDADASAPHVAEADQSFNLAGVTPGDTYLNQQALLDIAQSSGADAVHPGYGSVAGPRSGLQPRALHQVLRRCAPRRPGQIAGCYTTWQSRASAERNS